MRPRTDILDPPQQLFWSELGGRVPKHFVLYGGTAIALRLGHRRSIDFDFFSDRKLDLEQLEAGLPELARAVTLQRDPKTLVQSLSLGGADVKLSFFCELSIGRVGTPERAENGVAIAAPLDLLATKLKTLHDRVETKDYVDIEALLRSGLALGPGIMAARALFGERLNPLDTAKAVAWFKDGDLEQRLAPDTQRFLRAEAARFDPAEPAVVLASASLGAPERARSARSRSESER